MFRNLDVISSFPSEEERSRMEYRSKIELSGEVQIITIPGYDVCACARLTWVGRSYDQTGSDGSL